MDISNIYLKNESFEIFAHKGELKLVDLEINKGINDEYLQYGNSTTKWPFYTFF